MARVGFKTLARGTCVGHAFATPIRWGCAVEAFGCPIQPGQLIHADRQGFLVLPAGEEKGPLEAARYMDDLERWTKIAAARDHAGKSTSAFLNALDEAYHNSRTTAREHFSREGEAWDASCPRSRATL
jgi:4-hydroxy-4-methyl-2-oxoglutarate aldolase